MDEDSSSNHIWNEKSDGLQRVQAMLQQKINKDFYFQLQNSTRGMAVRTVAGLYVETQF